MRWEIPTGTVVGPYMEKARVVAISAQVQKDWAHSIGGRLPTAAEFDQAYLTANIRVPFVPRKVDTAPLDAMHEDVVKACNAQPIPAEERRIIVGKTWIDSNKPINYGGFVPSFEVKNGVWVGQGIKVYPTSSPEMMVIQPPGGKHGWNHVDYSQIGYAVIPRPHGGTVRRGSTGDDVAEAQRIVGVTADGVFGPHTEEAVKRWQKANRLLPDGIFGPKSWAIAGVHVAHLPDPRAPACIAALRDANAAWPDRSKASDGIMGDYAHQQRPSDHNLGNAVDITHDPLHGCDGEIISSYAILDRRVTYVIWSGRIYNRSRSAEGWRDYTGSNQHMHHVHISVRVDFRDDNSSWGWAP